MSRIIDRRQMLRGAALAGGGLALSAYIPAWAQTNSPGLTRSLPTVTGNDITLRIARQTMMIDGRVSKAIGINGTVPAPLIRLREGQNVRLNVINDLDEDSSIHWHGLLVPPQYDGVPGISFPGIKARSSFLYEFPIGRMAPIGITAIRDFRSSLVTMGQSLSIRPMPIRCNPIVSTSLYCPTIANLALKPSSAI
jgi:FtsP/CotA-like multicopper oxidase with cupredoxin domain